MCAFNTIGLDQHLRGAIDTTLRGNMPSQTMKELIRLYSERVKSSCDVNVTSVVKRANAQRTAKSAYEQYGNALSVFHLNLTSCKTPEEYR